MRRARYRAATTTGDRVQGGHGRGLQHADAPGAGQRGVLGRQRGREVFRSEPVHEGRDRCANSRALEKSREFVLQVGDGGDGIACDQADWVDAQIELADGQTVWLGDLPLLDARLRRPPHDPPFSFVLGGQHSSELLPQWNRTHQCTGSGNQGTEHTLHYRDPASGLAVRCEAVAYEIFRRWNGRCT